MTLKFSAAEDVVQRLPGQGGGDRLHARVQLPLPLLPQPDLVNGAGDSTLDEDEVLAFLASRKGRLTGLRIGRRTDAPRGARGVPRPVRALGLATKLDTNGSRPTFCSGLLDADLLDFVAMDVKAPLRKYDSLAAAPSIRSLVESNPPDRGVGRRARVQDDRAPPVSVDDDIVEIGETVRGGRRYVLQPFVSSHTSTARSRAAT